jgi:hypothetical protein
MLQQNLRVENVIVDQALGSAPTDAFDLSKTIRVAKGVSSRLRETFQYFDRFCIC